MSVIAGFKIAVAENEIVSVTMPSAVIVNVPLNVPAAIGANAISTELSVLLTKLNASPVSSTSTSVAFSTENVATPVAVSPT